MKIEKGIPIPRIRQKYPFPDMKVGDSILVKNQAGIVAAYAWGHRHNVRFVTRKEDKGFRVWRVK